MKTKKIAFVLAAAVLVADVLTKHIVALKIPYGGTIPILPGYFDLVHIMNRGVAFGMFSQHSSPWKNIALYGAAIIAAIMLIKLYRQTQNGAKLIPAAIGLLWGGIAGNVLDRIRFGAVVDFLSFHIRDVVVSGYFLGKNWNVALVWPAFNVADSAITISVLLLLISAIKDKKGFEG